MDETEAWLTHWRRGRDFLPQTFINPCPEVIITHLCSLGLQCNGTFLQHRSLENRVYAYGLESGGSIVVKLYRPGSWSRAAIEEEHLFLSELRAAGLDVACPVLSRRRMVPQSVSMKGLCTLYSRVLTGSHGSKKSTVSKIAAYWAGSSREFMKSEPMAALPPSHKAAWLVGG